MGRRGVPARLLAVALLVVACAASAAAQGASEPSIKVFKALGDFLGYKPQEGDTVFIPTDEAFGVFAKKWGLNSTSDLLQTRYLDLLARLGAYHVAEGSAPVKAAGLKDAQQVAMIGGNSLKIKKAGDGAISVEGASNAARVVQPDRVTGPALAHVIDSVLVPPDVYPSLLDAVSSRNDTKLWAGFFDKDEGVKARAADPAFSGTYFAPNDEGLREYARLDNVTLKAAFEDSKDLGLIVVYHSLPIEYTLEALRNASASQPLASSLQIGGVPEPVYHESNGSSVNLWGQLNLGDKSTIVAKDILVGAGTLHVIDFPLIPDLAASASASVAAVVRATPELGTMAKILNGTGILDELESPLFEGTLFAPTDEAFAAFAESMGFDGPEEILASEPLMDAILGYHLIPSAYPADALAKFAPFTVRPFTGGVLRFKPAGNATAGGNATAAAAVNATVNATVVTVVGGQNEAGIVTAGLDAGRSVVHTIDAVLLPESVFTSILSALEFYSASSVLQNLVADTPGLLAAVSDPKTNVTLFAPRNEAFAAMGPNFVAAASAPAANASRLEGLQYHAVPGARFVPAGFTLDGEKLPTLLVNETLTVDLEVSEDNVTKAERGTVRVVPSGGRAANVTLANIVAGRSVVHGIDGVLIPKSMGNA
ncbi:hypothetical protein Rsub_06723 [Raphidocelis subcapitata]|uniref:FAS1 domain-containing protein n=1 Tax=Raphidocelis subcapitata TaxID=307507 RepID=A0A2V0P424_9CHLO|nr:hypothetical protein Rsub_06723 [Raphidocelis subcapitata]|eukprot:GBF94608.1 hypothetical protein Rsub_06723 [Raphidocelis subcapitata]